MFRDAVDEKLFDFAVQSAVFLVYSSLCKRMGDRILLGETYCQPAILGNDVGDEVEIHVLTPIHEGNKVWDGRSDEDWALLLRAELDRSNTQVPKDGFRVLCVRRISKKYSVKNRWKCSIIVLMPDDHLVKDVFEDISVESLKDERKLFSALFGGDESYRLLKRYNSSGQYSSRYKLLP